MRFRKNRLHKKKDFEDILKNGLYRSMDGLTVRWKANNSSLSRFGIVVGKKVSLHAVERNRVKRRIREITRLFLREKRVPPGFDVVILPRTLTVNLPYTELAQNLATLLRRCHLFFLRK